MARKEQTRQRLQEEAIRLFSERGFDAVTVAEVARAAGVSHMTFFRHFPTKESVLFDDPYDPVLGAVIAAQDDDLTTFERVRRGILVAFTELDEPSDQSTRARISIVASHPSLRAGIWENNQRTEEVIVAALTASGVAELDARVAAGAVLGAVTAALLDWAQNEEAGSLGDRIRAAMHLLAAPDREPAA